MLNPITSIPPIRQKCSIFVSTIDSDHTRCEDASLVVTVSWGLSQCGRIKRKNLPPFPPVFPRLYVSRHQIGYLRRRASEVLDLQYLFYGGTK